MLLILVLVILLYVRYRSTVGDKGGGWVWLDKSGTLGTGAADNGIIFDATGATNWYWIRALFGQIPTPFWWGALGNGTTVDTVALQAWLDSPGLASHSSMNLWLPKGTFISDSLTLSDSNVIISGEGTIKLKDNATGVTNKGLFYISGDKNRIEGITFKGNKTAAPVVDYGSPMIVNGDDNRIINCSFHDAQADAPATATAQDNIRVDGNRNIIKDCRSFDAEHALYFNSGNDNHFIDCFGRRSSGTDKGFYSFGGSSADGTSLVLDKLDLDDVIECDWAAENVPKILERITVNNCKVVTAAANGAARFGHCRYLSMTNNHFECTSANNEALVFTERLYDVEIDNSFIKGLGASGSHIQSFPSGSKHRNINDFRLTNSIIGGTKTDPSANLDNNAIDVRAFKSTIDNCVINNFATNAVNIWPEEDGVIDVGLNTPPGSPSTDQVWVVGTSPTGAWTGEARSLAWWNGTAWVFEGEGNDLAYGIRVYDEDSTQWYEYINATDGWIVVDNNKFGLIVTNNNISGYKATDISIIGSDGVPASGPGEGILKRSDINQCWGNTVQNLGAGGWTETDSATIQPIYQQLGPKSWHGLAIPTQGTWTLGDRIWNSTKQPARLRTKLGLYCFWYSWYMDYRTLRVHDPRYARSRYFRNKFFGGSYTSSSRCCCCFKS